LKERRRARVLALRILYRWEITGDPLEEVISSAERELSPKKGLPRFTLELLDLIWRERERIDREIEGYANRWSLQRMPIIDRNLLRMGVAEILFREDIPHSVTVNECVELAKRYSTEDSGKFINGILGSLIRNLPPNP
jgi:N utilization substance protein B